MFGGDKMALINTDQLDSFYGKDEKFTTSVAYFSMEYAIHQSLKT
jgi:hypothetical protein